MSGVPCVRGTRIPVATVVGMIAQAMSDDEIIADFPQLTRDDIRASLHYAALAVEERRIPVTDE